MGLFRRRRDAYDDLDAEPDAPEGEDAGDLHDAFDDDQEDEEPGGVVAGVVSKVLAGVVVSGVFAAAILYAYSWSVGQQGERDEDLPVVEAEPGPEKVKPDDPGGMDVPYQDQLVLNEGANGNGEVEQLLPPPEEPKTAETGDPARSSDRDGSEAPADRDGAGAASGSPSTGNTTTEPGEQVASTEPARTPEGTADPDTESPSGTVRESGDQGQPGQTRESSGQARSGDGAGEPDTATSGETGDGGDAGGAEDGSASRETAARTERTDDGRGASGTGTFLVQLAAFENRENAENAWRRIQDKHRNVLGNQKLQLQRKRIPDKGVFWRVRTGPFPNRATADDLCGQLKDRGQPCLVMER